MRRHIGSILLSVSLLLSASSRATEASADEDAIYQGKSLAEWIGDLKDPVAANRSAAAQALAVFGPKKEVVTALAGVLKDDKSDVVVSAAKTLGQFGSKAKAALPELRAVFKRLTEEMRKPLHNGEVSTAPGDRCTIAEALVLIDDYPGAEFASILRIALDTDDARKRYNTVIRLGKLGPDAAKATVPVLIDCLKDKEGEVRREAAKSLGRLGSAARSAVHALTLSLKNAAPEKKNREVTYVGTTRQLVRESDRNTPTISVPGFPEDSEMVQACAEALGRIRPDAKGLVAAMRVALRDLDEGVRWAALCACANSDQDAGELAPILLVLLRDKEAAVRELAAEVLGKSGAGPKQILSPLTAALKDPVAFVRLSATEALGNMGSKAKPSSPALIVALKDEDTRVRKAAVRSLRKIGSPDKQAIAALVSVLGDEEESVREAAVHVLAAFGPLAKTAVPSLLVYLKDEKVKKRTGVCIILGRIGSAAKEAMPLLEKQSRGDSRPEVRVMALAALANIDSSRRKDIIPRLTTVLQEALRTQDNDLSIAAEIGLVLVGSDTLPALRELRDKSSTTAKRREYIDNVIDAVQHPDKHGFEW